MSDTNPNQDDNMPSPGPNEPVPTWPEFKTLRDAVEAYLAHEPPDPSYKQVTQAFAAMLGEHYRQKFTTAHGLSEPAETACIGRLIDGRERCPHNVVAQDDDPNAPPHSPPGDDHSTLWLNENGDPVVYGMHVYQGNIEMRASDDPPDSWFSIVGFAEHYGLELSILPYSWYNFGRTVHVIFSPPERYR
jgi:hypothetical protein